MSARRLPGRHTALIAVSVVLALATAACSSGSQGSSSSAALGATSSPSTNSSVIKIGLLSTLDGPFAVLGEAANRGAKLALLEAGAKLDGIGPRDGISGLKIGGKEVKLVVESSDATPDKAVEATRKLIESDGADAVVGPLSGDEGLAVKDYAKQHLDKTFVNGTSGAQNTTLRNPAPNFFRFTTDGAQWMAGLGKYVKNTLGYSKVVTLAEDYSFPYDQVGGFMKEFCAAGGHVPQKIWVPLGTKDYASFISKIPSGTTAIYVALGGADALNFIKQIDQTSQKGTKIIGGSITVDGSFIKSLGSRAEGIVSAGPVSVLNTPEYKAYADLYAKTYPGAGSPGLFDIGYYVEMKSLLKALVQTAGDLSNGQKTLQTALATTAWTTPIGPVKLDVNRQAIANNYLFKIKGGQSNLLATVPEVNQTLGFARDAYIAQPANDRDHPSCP